MSVAEPTTGSQRTLGAIQKYGVGDRIILVALTGLLTWFIGRTFDTLPLAVAFWLFCVVRSGILSEASDRTNLSQEADASKPVGNSVRMPMPIWATISLVGGLVMIWRLSSVLQPSGLSPDGAADLLSHLCWAIANGMWARQRRSGGAAILMLATFSVFIAAASGGVSGTSIGQTALGLTFVLGYTLMSHAVLSQPRTERGIRTTRIYSVSALLLLLVTTSAATRWTQNHLLALRESVSLGLRDQIQTSLAPRMATTGRYVEGRRLGDVAEVLITDPLGVALRGYCSEAPGYLRGNVFDHYRDGIWEIRQGRTGGPGSPARGATKRVFSSGPAAVRWVEPGTAQRRRFWVSPDQEPPSTITTVEIHGNPAKGSRVFLPLESAWIETKARSIHVNRHGVVTSGTRSDSAYLAGVRPNLTAIDLDGNDRSLLTAMDPKTRPMLERFAEAICGNATSANAVAMKLTQYFENQFTYSLDITPAPAGTDAIGHFLKTRHPAHCEYFAASAVLLMRAKGIPTRYVTGYVMDTRSDEEKYYIARNMDAHAWVEYFDDATGRWRTMEPTPGRDYRAIGSEENQQLSDLAAAEADARAAEQEKGWWARLESWWSSLRTTDSIVSLFRQAQFPLIVLLAGLLGFSWWRQARPGRKLRRDRRRRRMDRRALRWGLMRSPSETLHQFAKRIESSPPADGRKLRQWTSMHQAVAEWYRDHAERLYRGQLPE